jgi:GAF domain-containing protein
MALDTASGFPADEPILHQAGLLQAVAQLGPRLTAIRSLRRLLIESADLICGTFGLDSAIIYLLDGDKQCLIPQTEQSQSEFLSAELNAGLPPDDPSAVGRAAQQQTAIHVSAPADLADSPPGSELALPLTFENPIGALLLRARQHAFAPDDIAAFQLLADHLAVAIYNAQLNSRDALVLANTERRAHLLEAASQVGRDVTSILELDTLLDRIVEQALTQRDSTAL